MEGGKVLNLLILSDTDLRPTTSLVLGLNMNNLTVFHYKAEAQGKIKEADITIHIHKDNYKVIANRFGDVDPGVYDTSNIPMFIKRHNG